MKNHNEIIEIQGMLLKQMKRLDSSTAKSEIQIEINRSGALSQNAQAYLKAVATSLRVKDMVKNNPAAESTILNEIGVTSAE